jgi:hypothetical protein
MEEKENTTNYSTGYIPYKLKSNPNRVLIVPEEYGRKAGSLVKLTRGIESSREDSKAYQSLRAMADDAIYLTMCEKLSNDDVNSKEGAEKEDAIHRKEFFEAVLKNF